MVMLQESARMISSHELKMSNREKVHITGVTEVNSFDNQEIELITTQGAVRFEGEDLHVKQLTLEKGEVAIEGRIREIIYHEASQEKTAKGILSRLFR